MRKLQFCFISIIIGFTGFQCSVNNTVTEKIQNGIHLKTSDINVNIQFYADDIARIVKWNSKGKPEKLSLMVIQDTLPDINIDIVEKGQKILLSTNKLILQVRKKDGRIKFLNLDNNIVLKEEEAEFKPAVYEDDSAFNVKQNYSLSLDEGLYGLGQHQDGYMNYRNKKVTLVQSNTDAVTPMLISTHRYGILWDNYSKTIFEDNEKGAYLWSDVGDNIDYYFIYGENMDEVIAGYRDLTGHAPMYGKWAYGYWQSKEHYDNQEEILGVAKKYRKLKIPVDNIIQDWDYWNGHANWSGMFFDKTLFPRPKEMVDELHRMNYHIMISVWPALGPNTVIYKDMLQKGFLYEPVGWAGFKYYDAFNPPANQLYWKYLKEGLFSKGIDAWWIDSTEPDIVNALTKGATEYEMKKVGKNYIGSWARYLNAFSLSMTEAVYKNLRKETEEQRAYILTRSTYAGQQRNAATTWSGDIGARWDVYKNQISAGINHCMAGIPYWTFDIGAFVIGAYGGVFSTGGKNPAYQELYCRMFQFGTFTPIFRSHGSETPREIWEMGEFIEPIVKFDNLRYRLMPYIYSLAWKVTNEDYTIMRGLPMDFAHDKQTYSIDDQFMFGPAVMVCPVTDYMKYCPPQNSVLIESKYFRTKDGQKGLKVSYYKDPEFKNLSLERVDSNINIIWYTGRPDYVTDSMYSIRWEGKLITDQTGKHQFHLLSFDTKRIFLDGKQLQMIYTSTEQRTEYIELEAGKEYDLVMEIENRQTGAAKAMLYWKTPDLFAKEESIAEKEKTREVYLPAGTKWIDFWTGKVVEGGQNIIADAPIEIIPLFVKAGSIIPMGPFVQYATEKPADPLELRIYPGADGSFILYEDENDNYNYEKGVYATIEFIWNDTSKELTINDRKGEFPGMLKERTINIVLIEGGKGTGIKITDKPDKSILYNGNKHIVQF